MFWLLATLIFLLAVVLALFPIIREKSRWQIAAFAMAGGIPLLGFFLYDQVGSPHAINLAPPPVAADLSQNDVEQMVEQLKVRMSEDGSDLEGWLLLIRTLKTMQRYDEALTAAEDAHEAQPDDPWLMVELVESRIFTSEDGRITEDDTALLERSLELDEDQQKALWLLGIGSAQSGNYQQAIIYWESLLTYLEPGGSVAVSVQQQIQQARAELGIGITSAPALPVTVRMDGVDVSSIPANAVLFVIARPADESAGPPLAVKRVDAPVFPVDIALSDADSMMEARKLSSVSSIQLQARLSLSGTPTAQAGDWQSAAMAIELEQTPNVELVIDQQVE